MVASHEVAGALSVQRTRAKNSKQHLGLISCGGLVPFRTAAVGERGRCPTQLGTASLHLPGVLKAQGMNTHICMQMSLVMVETPLRPSPASPLSAAVLDNCSVRARLSPRKTDLITFPSTPTLVFLHGIHQLP